jgi:hypothetical protein
VQGFLNQIHRSPDEVGVFFGATRLPLSESVVALETTRGNLLRLVKLTRINYTFNGRAFFQTVTDFVTVDAFLQSLRDASPGWTLSKICGAKGEALPSLDRLVQHSRFTLTVEATANDKQVTVRFANGNEIQFGVSVKTKFSELAQQVKAAYPNTFKDILFCNEEKSHLSKSALVFPERSPFFCLDQSATLQCRLELAESFTSRMITVKATDTISDLRRKSEIGRKHLYVDQFGILNESVPLIRYLFRTPPAHFVAREPLQNQTFLVQIVTPTDSVDIVVFALLEHTIGVAISQCLKFSGDYAIKLNGTFDISRDLPLWAICDFAQPKMEIKFSSPVRLTLRLDLGDSAGLIVSWHFDLRAPMRALFHALYHVSPRFHTLFMGPRPIRRPSDGLVSKLVLGPTLRVESAFAAKIDLLFGNRHATSSVDSQMLLSHLLDFAGTVFELDSSKVYRLKSFSDEDLSLPIASVGDLQFHVIELCELKFSGAIAHSARFASDATAASLADFVRTARATLSVVSTDGQPLDPAQTIAEILGRHGPHFFVLEKPIAVEVEMEGRGLATFLIEESASVSCLREFAAKRLGCLTAQIEILNDSGRLDDELIVKNCVGVLRCQKVRRPADYNQRIAQLMRESGQDRRVVGRCFNFHKYNYDEALRDLKENATG